MSTPFDPNPGNQQYGQPPQFGAPVPPGPQQPPQPAQPVQPQDAAPWGQQAPTQAAPAWGTQPTAPYPDPNANPYAAGDPYQQPYAGVPMQQKPVKQRGTGVAGFFAVLFRTVIGRIVVFLLIAGGIALYHFATADNAQRNSNGQVSQAGSLNAWDLAVGDCFDAPSATTDISTIKAIPCTQAHDSQVYAEPAITESTYPGDSTLTTEAKNDCSSDSAQSTIASDTPSSVQLTDYLPQDATTFASQRYIICVLVADSQTLTMTYVTSASAAS
jgi:hypothetical protein